MEKITYGAPRLVDWVAQIKSGAATVRVHFTGGALTTYGVTPAEYTTANPFIQKVIENSDYFKEGRIVALRRVCTPASSKVEVAQPVETPTSTAEAGGEMRAESGEPRDVTVVEVTCLQDAQAYLQEHFNISSYKVRSYEAAQRAAAGHGIQFSGAKFDAIDKGEQGAPEAEEEE